MFLYNKNYSKNEIRQKIGDIYQIGGIKQYAYTDGVSKGIRAVEIKNGNGLNAIVLIDRGMDISHLEYKGVPICWNSSNFETSPAYYDTKGSEWLKTFYGGILTTCGLTYAGHPSTDMGEDLGLHGRIANVPAYNVHINEYWLENDYFMEVHGLVRESSVFGNKLELKRKISTKMGEAKLFVDDSVKNIGFEDSPHMIIYHINIGFPVLDNNSVLVEPESNVIPFDDNASKGLINYSTFDEPIKGYKENVFLHDIKADKSGYATAAIINEEFEGMGIGFYIKFNKNNLPYLHEWKMIGQGEYVVGIEPANCNVYGRAIERKEGRLRSLKPDEEVQYHIEMGILKSKKEIDAYNAYVKAI